MFDTHATGALSEQRNTWELMGWGYDTEEVGYIFLYEDAPTTGGLANICIEVRKWGHPTEETRMMLFDALRAFEVSDLTDLTDRVVKLRHDSRRAGLTPFACDQPCTNNTYTVEAMERTAKEAGECPR